MYMNVIEYQGPTPQIILTETLDAARDKAREWSNLGYRVTIYRHEPFATNVGIARELETFDGRVK